jgi:predicted acylesterase/phospholipase RssA
MNGQPQYTAANLRDLYFEEGEVIFPQPSVPLSLWSEAKRAFAEQYTSSGMESVLKKYFGDSRLKDSFCNLLLTSYELGLRQPWFFRSDRARCRADYDFALWEAALATSAAPTYFAPARIARRGRQPWMLIDGGTYANNPALCAYAEARQIEPDCDVFLVSLGTGRHVRAIDYRPGLLGWAKPILDVVFDGVSRTIEYQLEQLLPPVLGHQRYYRFQTDLAIADAAMDDPRPASLRRLKDRAENLVRDRITDLEEVCACLMN